MRSLLALSALVLLVAGPARAESRVFIIASESGGYGINQCLSNGEECGAHAAGSYCRARDFALASAYRRVDSDEITGAIPNGGDHCTRARCDDYVAITCQR